MKALSFSEIETVRGRFMLLFHDGGIYEIFFPGTAPPLHCERRPLPWPGLERELQRYLKGQQPAWDDYPLDMSGYPPFTRSLLSAVRRIPYGETRSYREVAAEAGSPRAWRAAGQALKANRHPLLVPCHRVIRSDGRPGGFSGPPGWKEMLLHLELVN
ncbi:MAG TPA: methylated-DNA--[protein]-cysteine S-methyltransferase [Bacillota bacterium]|jgi:O-6-methylguanine DNA methyltransferase|nr:methylated-DNA--[protein]-cysteine S-methyltransferase [Bacillota bacterium]HOA35168.1 methylated-DNA--[protein]-cysteine S-methyltransferase [Bacillota bacterium]HOJ85197.1 methylated-DNA--[protein]-cysteine S-methyltransferase [Bacillota bacterium]HOL16035.1 methylated-DNA--[protein]-cysteine S-methyltransferase [Bacillota bacterium]HPZ12236.1 methylated-DNA--[protein]-cysteine S-methyltransferase [Bacillota bacterium]